MRYKENIVQRRRIQPSNTNQVPILDEETGYLLLFNEYLVKHKQLVVTRYPDFFLFIISISFNFAF